MVNQGTMWSYDLGSEETQGGDVYARDLEEVESVSDRCDWIDPTYPPRTGHIGQLAYCVCLCDSYVCPFRTGVVPARCEW